MARNPSHNWVEEKEKERREKSNQDGTSTLERELLKRKGTHSLGSPLTNAEVSEDRGTSKLLRKGQQLDRGGQSRVRAAQIICTTDWTPQPKTQAPGEDEGRLCGDSLRG